MSRPIVAITTGRRNENSSDGRRQTVINGLPLDYVNGVARAGGSPVLIPRVPDPEALAPLLDCAHAVLLSGGGDIVSLRYGEEPHPANKYQDPIRDETEFAVIRLAMERELPILGICRGIQSLNVALGGTLIQDIPTQVKDPLLHYVYAQEPVPVHTIAIEAQSLLADIFGMTSTSVNSWHHQAVKDLAPGFRIVARTGDGVVEAIENTVRQPILGVQWHPEDMAEQYPLARRLFDWLVAEAAQRKMKG